jgi:hypothetical protein
MGIEQIPQMPVSASEMLDNEKAVDFLTKQKDFEKKLREGADVVSKTGQESHFQWVLFKNGKMKITDPVAKSVGCSDSDKKTDMVIDYNQFDDKKKTEKILIYGNLHFHPERDPLKIIPSRNDLSIFICKPLEYIGEEGKQISQEEFDKKLETEKKWKEYTKNLWEGTGILKDDNSINLLLIGRKTIIGPVGFNDLFYEIEAANEFLSQIKLLEKYGFKTRYFENFSRLK